MFTERYKSHHDASRNPKMRYTADTAGAEYLLAVLAGKAASRRVIYLHVHFTTSFILPSSAFAS